MTETTRRRLTAGELRIWRDYVETAEIVRARLGSRLQSESSLSSGDYQVLLALSEAPGRRLRSSELAASVGWERSRLSHHLGRMEGRGLIRREACAADSRGAEIVLSEEGADAFRRGSVAHLRAIREMFLDAYDPEELAEIGALTTRLRDHLGLGSTDRAEA